MTIEPVPSPDQRSGGAQSRREGNRQNVCC